MFFSLEKILEKTMLTVEYIGFFVLKKIEAIGIFIFFFINFLQVLVKTKPKIEKIIEQINRIGVQSLGIIILTGSFSGMVFALQAYIGFQRVGGEQYIGAVVALGMIKELGPVLTGLMTIGRAGSAIAAELGTMQISEQIDALKTLRINTIQYLVVPRIVASIVALPLLTLFSIIFGIGGGYVVSVYILGLNSEDYLSSIRTYVELSDVTNGLTKATFFGLILGSVATFKGFFATGGARGVGFATTQTVVLSSISVLGANYILTKLLEHL